MYIYVCIYVHIAQWGGVEGMVAECGTWVLKTVRPISVSVYLATPIEIARAMFLELTDLYHDPSLSRLDESVKGTGVVAECGTRVLKTVSFISSPLWMPQLYGPKSQAQQSISFLHSPHPHTSVLRPEAPDHLHPLLFFFLTLGLELSDTKVYEP